ncbi:MAG: [Fe-Fe] hydrogenase large subunit C-terminal domain-containing protein [Thermoguttaceae bacterium]
MQESLFDPSGLPRENAMLLTERDYGLTPRELAKMIREAGVDLPKLAKSDFDHPFRTAAAAGVIFGAAGGGDGGCAARGSGTGHGR